MKLGVTVSPLAKTGGIDTTSSVPAAATVAAGLAVFETLKVYVHNRLSPLFVVGPVKLIACPRSAEVTGVVSALATVPLPQWAPPETVKLTAPVVPAVCAGSVAAMATGADPPTMEEGERAKVAELSTGAGTMVSVPLAVAWLLGPVVPLKTTNRYVQTRLSVLTVLAGGVMVMTLVPAVFTSVMPTATPLLFGTVPEPQWPPPEIERFTELMEVAAALSLGSVIEMVRGTVGPPVITAGFTVSDAGARTGCGLTVSVPVAVANDGVVAPLKTVSV